MTQQEQATLGDAAGSGTVPGVTRRIVDQGVPMAARDGVVLRSVVHRLAGRRTQPIVLVRNPYGEPLTRGLPIAPLLGAGFAVVVQDCRGTADSDGKFVPFETEATDTLDAIDWCGTLPFSNGTVVMYGASYSGMVQLAAAVHRPDALAGIIPVVTPDDYQTRLAYRGGAFQLGQLTGWYTMKALQSITYRAQHGEQVGPLFAAFGAHAADPYGSVTRTRLADAPVLSEVLPTWRTWTTNDTTGDYWPSVSYRDRRAEVAVPGLHVGGWFDLFLGGTISNFATLRERAATERARDGQRLIVGPWQHTDQSGTVGDLSFGPPASAAGLGLEGIVTDFAAATAAGAQIAGPPIRLYVMNDGWRDEHEWPLARTTFTPWYLQPGGGLGPAVPDVDAAAADASTSYVHDPADPVPMIGGQSGIMAGGLDGGNQWTAGPRDQRPLDGRDDVLRFTGEPLAADTEVTGPVEVVLHAATSADDADFVARLVDVYPDGRAIGVVDGVVRAKFRDGQDEAKPVTPGEVTELRIDLWATSWCFAAGHRIRIDIASSSYPNWDVNQGGAGNNALVEPGSGARATQHIHHCTAFPSHVVLPLIPASTGPASTGPS
ncbi:X-Pro dipeptidyl-peptidase [Pseudoclavibacter endophyticus]|uniref:CocE/NonD family hydrolase n=1 Tax=Pseudoclavibacter endophyticus TaxID=1778590 RepID=A0A6H9WLH4_9MICO|nr:CocE/NonD family hydrolase [Pseudoclavibacter endophyticus]KAB1648918.1 CocE/NonD family hydrolase [Pseudoclavibacter endophyticus]GGA67257.1 X-Pro dipeptidyl-peptidase [Pseudoclavibacter endophyticus]